MGLFSRKKITSRFSDEHEILISEALNLQEQLLANEDFYTHLLELSKTGSIDWNENQLKQDIEDYTENLPNPMTWFVEQLKVHGGYKRQEIMNFVPKGFGRLMYSKTTAISAAGKKLQLNSKKLNRSKFSVANTLIHERVHWLGHKHINGQSRPDNCCDAAYMIGDLAGSFLNQFYGGDEANSAKTICGDLKSYLEVNDLPT